MIYRTSLAISFTAWFYHCPCSLVYVLFSTLPDFRIRVNPMALFGLTIIN